VPQLRRTRCRRTEPALRLCFDVFDLTNELPGATDRLSRRWTGRPQYGGNGASFPRQRGSCVICRRHADLFAFRDRSRKHPAFTGLV